jgi:Raf kinase inhibitor-like YbhB/YbcL family protein
MAILCNRLLVAAACVFTFSQIAASQPSPTPTFTVSSPAFQDGGLLPKKYASVAVGDRQCGGQNVSPPLGWTNVPEGTRSLAIVAFDSDGNKGLAGNIHWVAYDIPTTMKEAPEGAGMKEPTDFIGGLNGRKQKTYFGPCASATEQAHHYLFTVFATDLSPGQLGPDLNRDQLLSKLQGHVLASGSIVGRFNTANP